MHPEVIVREFTNVTLEQLEHVAHELLAMMGSTRVCLLHGDMGAGKTTFVKAVCNVLGVTETMSSPTFAIINEYRTDNDDAIFHFDFYRIRSEAEAYDIGTEEYFYSGHYCFVEWPERIPGLLPDQYVSVTLTTTDPEHRTIAITRHG